MDLTNYHRSRAPPLVYDWDNLNGGWDDASACDTGDADDDNDKNRWCEGFPDDDDNGDNKGDDDPYDVDGDGAGVNSLASRSSQSEVMPIFVP